MGFAGQSSSLQPPPRACPAASATHLGPGEKWRTAPRGPMRAEPTPFFPPNSPSLSLLELGQESCSLWLLDGNRSSGG